MLMWNTPVRLRCSGSGSADHVTQNFIIFYTSRFVMLRTNQWITTLGWCEPCFEAEYNNFYNNRNTCAYLTCNSRRQCLRWAQVLLNPSHRRKFSSIWRFVTKLHWTVCCQVSKISMTSHESTSLSLGMHLPGHSPHLCIFRQSHPKLPINVRRHQCQFCMTIWIV